MINQYKGITNRSSIQYEWHEMKKTRQTLGSHQRKYTKDKGIYSSCIPIGTNNTCQSNTKRKHLLG